MKNVVLVVLSMVFAVLVCLFLVVGLRSDGKKPPTRYDDGVKAVAKVTVPAKKTAETGSGPITGGVRLAPSAPQF